MLAELEVIRLPEYRFHRSYDLNGQCTSIARVVVPAVSVAIDRVQIETPIGSIIPDVIIERGGRKLLVEVEVTHAVDRVKLRVVRKLNVAMLQIRLDRADVHLPREALKLKIERDDRCKQWLFNPRQRDAEREWVVQRRRLVRMARATRSSGKVDTNAPPGDVRRRPVPTWATRPKSKDDSALWRDFDAWAYRHQQVTGKPSSLDAYRRHAKRIRPT